MIRLIVLGIIVSAALGIVARAYYVGVGDGEARCSARYQGAVNRLMLDKKEKDRLQNEVDIKGAGEYAARTRLRGDFLSRAIRFIAQPRDNECRTPDGINEAIEDVK